MDRCRASDRPALRRRGPLSGRFASGERKCGIGLGRYCRLFLLQGGLVMGSWGYRLKSQDGGVSEQGAAGSGCGSQTRRLRALGARGRLLFWSVVQRSGIGCQSLMAWKKRENRSLFLKQILIKERTGSSRVKRSEGEPLMLWAAHRISFDFLSVSSILQAAKSAAAAAS